MTTETISKEMHENAYASILAFYDFADSLLDTVDQAPDENVHDQLKAVEPIVMMIEAATDTLAEEYRHFVQSDKRPGFLARKRIETAVRQIYAALCECQKYVPSKRVEA